MKKRIFVVLLSVVFVVSCREQKEEIPSNVLPPDQMVRVMIDIHLLEANLASSNIPRDSSLLLFSLYKKDLHRKHNINDSLYTRSFDYYTKHPDLIDKVYKEVIDTLSLKAERAKM